MTRLRNSARVWKLNKLLPRSCLGVCWPIDTLNLLYYIFYFKHWVEINGNLSFQGSGLVILRNKVGHEQEKKKNGKFILSLVDDVYKHTILRCVDRDVTVLLLLTNSSKRNISVLRGSVATHVDKNTKSTNNKLATMTSKWKSLIACERKNMFQIIRVHNLLSQFLYLYC